MTYSGSAWRILRMRHRLRKKGLRAGLTPLLLILLVLWWVAVTIWYPFYSMGRVLMWSLRIEQRRAKRRARKAEREARKPGPETRDAERTPHE
jgi:hypothetical protein